MSLQVGEHVQGLRRWHTWVGQGGPRSPISCPISSIWLLLSYILYNVSESEVAQSCPTLCDPMDCRLPGSSVHRTLQARILEWVAISLSGWSSQPRVWTQVSHIVGRRFTIWATREASTQEQILGLDRAQFTFCKRWKTSVYKDGDTNELKRVDFIRDSIDMTSSFSSSSF